MVSGNSSNCFKIFSNGIINRCFIFGPGFGYGSGVSSFPNILKLNKMLGRIQPIFIISSISAGSFGTKLVNTSAPSFVIKILSSILTPFHSLSNHFLRFHKILWFQNFPIDQSAGHATLRTLINFSYSTILFWINIFIRNI